MSKSYDIIPEIRVYVINCHDTDFDFRKAEGDKNYKAIMKEAERLGTVYSLQGFQKAVNNDEVYLDNSFILIRGGHMKKQKEILVKDKIDDSYKFVNKKQFMAEYNALKFKNKKTKKFLCKVCQGNSTTNVCGVCNMCIENKIDDRIWTADNWEKEANEYDENIPYKKEYDC